MKKQYTFDFTTVTYDELTSAGILSNDDFLLFLDKVTVGGIRHLSSNEVYEGVVVQLVPAVKHWVQYGRIGDVMPPAQSSRPEKGSSASDEDLHNLFRDW